MTKPRLTAWRRKLMAVPLTLAVLVFPTRALAGCPQLPQALIGSFGIGIHATRGIVLSIDPGTMVIARTGKLGIMTFTLTSSTHREGVIVVDSPVSVRYRDDGKNHIATAITLQRIKE